MARRKRQPTSPQTIAANDRVVSLTARRIARRARLELGAKVPAPDPQLPAAEQLSRTIALAEKLAGADAVARWLGSSNDRGT